MSRTCNFYVAVFLLLATSAFAERNDGQSWNKLTFQKNFGKEKNYSLALEYQQRFADNFSKNERYLFRPSLSYSPNSSFTHTACYAWISQFLDSEYEDVSKGEHRPWEQIVYRKKYNSLQLQFRLRQEQRQFHDTKEWAHRSRFLIGQSYFLSDKEDYGIESTQEIFFNLNTVNNNFAGYDRSRIFLGPFFVYDHIRYDLGYTGEHVHRFGGNVYVIHALSVFVTVNF